MFKRLKDIYNKIETWAKNNTFIAGVTASITASIIISIASIIISINSNQKVDQLIASINISNTEDNDTIIKENSNNSINNNNGDNNSINNNNGDNININGGDNINNNNGDNNSPHNIINNGGTINYNYYSKDEIINPTFISTSLKVFNEENINTETITSKNLYRCYEPIQSSNILVRTEEGQEYSYNDLINTTIAFNYTENGKDVFFKGQYDENGYWDGNCVINYYSNGKLNVIMDANYDSGTLISYKRVSIDTKIYDSSEYEVWSIADRTIEGDSNRGETWTYFKYSDYIQNFDTSNVSENDILNVDDFKSKIELFPESYYNGYTSNRYYNDTTGNALLIKFFAPDTFDNDKLIIRTLYRGNLKNGQFDDDTGNAWYITREPGTTYMYYIGLFSEGNTIDTPTSDNSKNYLTHKQIDEYLNDHNLSEYSSQFVTEYEEEGI